MRKTADTLKRGDVVRVDGYRWVVIEPSDTVDTAPPDAMFEYKGKLYQARDCCEPRLAFLGSTGRVTHHVTYMIFPNKRTFTIHEFLDLDIRSAVPEPA